MLDFLLYRLKRPYHFIKTGLLQGLPAQIKYHFPNRHLTVVCVTGTDGKTTTSTLLYEVLKAAGKKVALLSTVAAYIGDDQIDTGFHVTTPDPAQIQKFMRRMVDEGYQYLVLEATSHGIYQSRLRGVVPKIVGITNITLEHLDYHLTHDLYVAAKAILAKKAEVSIINADDEMSFSKLKKELKDTATKIKTYSAQDELPAVVLKAISDRFSEPYNQMNSRLVYAMASELGVSDKDFVKGLKQFNGVPGRMETIGHYHGAEIIIDFAHTPKALEEVLYALQEKINRTSKNGQLIAVFGCAGLRDWKKRPLMGRIGAELANVAIFTAEDPRTEDVWCIIRQMKGNLGEYQAKVISIADRATAIQYALEHYAEPNNIIGIFGKGHEKSMSYGTVEYPWSDQEAVKQVMRGKKLAPVRGDLEMLSESSY